MLAKPSRRVLVVLGLAAALGGGCAVYDPYYNGYGPRYAGYGYSPVYGYSVGYYSYPRTRWYQRHHHHHDHDRYRRDRHDRDDDRRWRRWD